VCGAGSLLESKVGSFLASAEDLGPWYGIAIMSIEGAGAAHYASGRTRQKRQRLVC
jgi:hypothetical protein